MKWVKSVPFTLVTLNFVCESQVYKQTVHLQPKGFQVSLSGFIPVECNADLEYKPEVHLLQPKGFSVSISDARDIRQLHIFWNFRKPYNRSNPYSTTDFTNVSFNENFDRMLTVSDTETHLRVGDSIFYWLLLVTREWERVTLHKQNFWVRFDQKTWTTVAEPFAETYYRDFENFYTKDEI